MGASAPVSDSTAARNAASMACLFNSPTAPPDAVQKLLSTFGPSWLLHVFCVECAVLQKVSRGRACNRHETVCRVAVQATALEIW